MKNLKQIYSLAVCYISTMILLFSFTASVLSVLDLTIPQYRYKSHLTKFSSIERFMLAKDDQEKEKIHLLTKEEISTKMKFERASFIQDKKDGVIEDLIRYLSVIVMSMIFWIIHWRIYKLDTSSSL